MDLSGAIKKVVSFLDLKENWDSYGAKPTEPIAVAYAVKELGRLWLMKDKDDSPSFTMSICPRNDGGIEFEWDDGLFLTIDECGGILEEKVDAGDC